MIDTTNKPDNEENKNESPNKEVSPSYVKMENQTSPNNAETPTPSKSSDEKKIEDVTSKNTPTEQKLDKTPKDSNPKEQDTKEAIQEDKSLESSSPKDISKVEPETGVENAATSQADTLPYGKANDKNDLKTDDKTDDKNDLKTDDKADDKNDLKTDDKAKETTDSEGKIDQHDLLLEDLLDNTEAPTIQIPKEALRQHIAIELEKKPEKEPDKEPDKEPEKEPEKEPKKEREKEPEKEPENKTLKISCHKCNQKLDVTYLEPFSEFDCPSCQNRLIVPKWFDNYLLEEPGGVGGMATVYRALDLALDREVAIKILDPEVASEKERSELFLHEARTAATINHHAVVPIYTCGEFEDQPYIIMQYMHGGSLEDKFKLERKLLPVTEVSNWIKDVCEGLDNARRHGIIHHDIKPGNIMLDNDGNAKVCDFGIAQALHDRRTQKIYEMTKGWISPHYVSPEKVSTHREDFLGDIYSLGATYYHLLTSTPPFDIENVDELLRVRLNHDPKPIKEVRQDIHPKIANLVMAMMDRDPQRRPDYKEIVKSIDSYLAEFKKSGPIKKKSGKSGTMKNLRSQIKLDQISNPYQESKKRSNSVLVHLSISLITFVLFLFLWKIGFFETAKKYVQTNLLNQSIASDPLPSISKAFALGDSRKAARLASQILDNPSENLQIRKHAGLRLALANHLNNISDAKDSCGDIASSLQVAGIDPLDSELAIIIFLNNNEISDQVLINRLKDEPKLELIGHVAIFLRSLYDNQSSHGNVQILGELQRQLSSSNKKSWAEIWRKRMPEWSDCIGKSRGNPSSLEPIMAQMVKVISTGNTSRPRRKPRKTRSGPIPNIANLTPEWLKQKRNFAEFRPRPKDFVFNSPEISSYLSNLSTNQAKMEKMRIEQIGSLKNHICQLTMRWPYDGKQIKLRNGKVLRTTSIMTNDKLVFVKLANKKRKRLAWSDLSLDQFAEILDFYARTRESSGDAGNVSQKERKKEASWEYLRIAMLYDWFGDYAKAIKYMKKAAAVDPAITGSIQRYLLK